MSPVRTVEVLDHVMSEIAMGGKMGIGATRKIKGEGSNREWPPLIKTDPAVKAKAIGLYKGLASEGGAWRVNTQEDLPRGVGSLPYEMSR